MQGAWTIRRATPTDIPSLMLVAAAAWRDTYASLLSDRVIEAFIERAYSRERLQERISGDHFYVAEGPDGIAAFADALERRDHLELLAIYAAPEARGRGAGTALLATLVELFPGRRIAADVVKGNRKGEVFYERRGFVPRETIETALLGEPVTERRWWRPAEQARQSSPGR